MDTLVLRFSGPPRAPKFPTAPAKRRATRAGVLRTYYAPPKVSIPVAISHF